MRKLIDCLVAAAALCADCDLLHADIDFDSPATCTDLHAIRA